MDNHNDVIKTLVNHVQTFQKHAHPVVNILMKGFSKVIVRNVFTPGWKRIVRKKSRQNPPITAHQRYSAIA